MAKMAQRRSKKPKLQDDTELENSMHTILLTLESNKRYAHTATCLYQITMASLQPEDKKSPHCICNSINEEKRANRQNENRVLVIVEHNLKEYIICILEPGKQTSCKLDMFIKPGEQIAFRTIGKIPILLTGLSSDPLNFR